MAKQSPEAKLAQITTEINRLNREIAKIKGIEFARLEKAGLERNARLFGVAIQEELAALELELENQKSIRIGIRAMIKVPPLKLPTLTAQAA